MDARIVGWGHSKFGRLEESFEDMVVSVVREALDSSGLKAEDVDAIYLGHFNAGLVPDGFTSSMVLQADEGLRFKPATRCENACASGSAAVYSARNAIRSGDARVVLVVGAEKMTSRDTAGVTESLGSASYQKEEGGMSFPAIFGRVAGQYFQEFGDHSEELAMIAAKNHRHGLRNPLAHMQKDVGFDFCNNVSEKNPLIAPPLRLTDCSLITDGAAAMVMVADDMEGDFTHSIAFRAAAHVNDFLPMSRRNMTDFEGPRESFRQAFEMAGVTHEDIDFAEVHDCFTIAELLIYESIGLKPKGKGGEAIREGLTELGGALPINVSGGLKAKGHPVGATGVSMHVMSAMQLTGQAGEMQVENAKLGCVFNMGGSGVANYCSVLENAKNS